MDFNNWHSRGDLRIREENNKHEGFPLTTGHLLMVIEERKKQTDPETYIQRKTAREREIETESEREI